MNPGYVSSIMMIITLILCSSGWKSTLARGLSHRTILLFFMLWMAGSILSFSIHSVTIYGVFVVVFGVFVVSFVQISNRFIQIHVLLVGGLLGALYFLLNEMLVIEPMFRLYWPFLHLPLSLSIILILLYHQPLLQAAACSLAVMFGHGLTVWHNAASSSIVLGDKLFQDHWWLMMLSVRVGSEVLIVCRRACVHCIQAWNQRRRD